MNTITIFTDGSAINNGKSNCKSGIGVFFGLNNSKNISKEISGTNQYAELLAIYHALNSVKNDKYEKIFICTDSMYAINCITKWIKNWKKNNWKTAGKKDVKHKELIKQIDDLMTANVCFKHVRSHKKEPSKESEEWKFWFGNYCADLLARNKKIDINY